MNRTTSLLAVLTAAGALLAAPAAAQVTGQMGGAPLDETPEGGLEEAAALYFAPPADEAPMPAIDIEQTRNAGAVALAIALGRVEEGIDACRDLRDEMQQLIGDTYGSYSVNPGWLRTYQNCLLRRGEEADAISEAIEARQRELIERTAAAAGTEDEADSEAALRAADLMARLSARQSAVRRALRQEGRMQQAFVRYYNTGKRPDLLTEAPARPAVAVPAGERSLGAPAPIRIDPPARRPAADGTNAAGEPIQTDILLPSDRVSRPNAEAGGADGAAEPLGGAIILPTDPAEQEGEAPLSRVPGPRGADAPSPRATTPAPTQATQATGAPVPLRPANQTPRDGVIGAPASPE